MLLHRAVRICLLLTSVAVCPLPNRADGQGLMDSFRAVTADSTATKAATPAAKTGKPTPLVADVDATIARLEAELATRGSTASSTQDAASHRVAELEHWRRVRLELKQQETLAAANRELTQRLTEAKQQLSTLRDKGPPESPPYSFIAVDELRDDQARERQQLRALETQVELARDKVDNARNRVDNLKRRERLLTEAVQRARPGEQVDRRQDLLRLQRDDQLAQQQLRVAELEWQQQQAAKEILDAELLATGLRIEAFSAKAIFGKELLDAKIQFLVTRSRDLQQQLWRVQQEMQVTESSAQSAQAPSASATADGEYLKTLQLRERVLQAHERYLRDQLERIREQQVLWNRRFHVFAQTASADEATAWRRDSLAAQKQLDRAKRVLPARTDLVRAEWNALLSESGTPAGPAPSAANYRNLQARELERLIAIFQADLTSIESHRRLHTKFLEETKNFSAIETAAALVDNSWRRFTDLWNYELVAVDGSPITVKKVVIGLLLILVGYYLSRGLAWFLGRTVLPRLGISGNAAMPLQTIAFYLGFFTFALFALRVVSVPLTAFTVLGGALAIGVGVGSQTIANNFISGLILLAERPIRVGDTVEIDGVFGVVQEIGARATRIRTSKNLDVFLPNSRLLEQNLTNWTLTDNRTRSSLRVGVAYGSPTRRVAELLLQATHDHAQILKSPAPQVFFAEFGDNALTFEVQYWTSLAPGIDRQAIESQLRFVVERAFREERISMPFPQRDIHWDADSAITVRWAEPMDATSAPGRGRAA